MSAVLVDEGRSRRWFSGYLADLFRPSPREGCEAWTEEHFRLPKGNRYVGKFRIDRNPTLRGPLRAIDSGLYRRIVCVCGSQVWKSTVIQIFFGWVTDQDPGPGMIVYPDNPMRNRRSKKYLQPLIEECEAIRKHKTMRKTDISTAAYTFDSCEWSLAGAKSEWLCGLILSGGCAGMR